MRDWIGFVLFLLAVVGCTWDPPQDDCWSWDRPCNGGGGCPVCDGVVCEDDGNECTEDICNCDTGECGLTEALDGFGCELDGATGICVDGLCQEDVWCNGRCDDGNECTVDRCYLDEGTCSEDEGVLEDGAVCSDGFCRDGACVALVDQCSADDLAAIEAGDEPDADQLVACREDWNAVGGGEEELGCITAITNCVQESGTSLGAECSSCFALRACCMIYECGCESPEPRCYECLQESCHPLVDACIGAPWRPLE